MFDKKKYNKEYKQRTEVKARRKEYMREYYLKEDKLLINSLSYLEEKNKKQLIIIIRCLHKENVLLKKLIKIKNTKDLDIVLNEIFKENLKLRSIVRNLTKLKIPKDFNKL